MSTAVKAKRSSGRQGTRARTFSKKKPAQRPARMTLEELMHHPAFGMWKDKTISVEEEIRQWRKPRYGLG
jgi:hypothetical protein